MEKLQKTLDNIGDAFTVLNDIWEENHKILDNAHYPFEKPFDEVYTGFLYYRSSCENRIKIELENKKEIPITYATIQRRIGWSRFAEETNRNVYAINEFGDYEPNKVFYITEAQAEKLNL